MGTSGDGCYADVAVAVVTGDVDRVGDVGERCVAGVDGDDSGPHVVAPGVGREGLAYDDPRLPGSAGNSASVWIHRESA